jgi:8-oxo-dGTP pyrophosphatase MutT (NUDIX family)
MRINVSVIVVHKNKVLLMQRSLTDDYFAGAWGIPGGYMKDFENTLEDTAKREVKEELGVDVVPDQIRFNNRNVETETLYLVYTAKLDNIADYPDGPSVSSEANDYSWASKDDLEKLEFTPYTKDRLVKILDGFN